MYHHVVDLGSEARKRDFLRATYNTVLAQRGSRRIGVRVRVSPSLLWPERRERGEEVGGGAVQPSGLVTAPHPFTYHLASSRGIGSGHMSTVDSCVGF